MTLVPGKRLGPYEVLAPLGAGGMGEVWRARDTRLAREVALKVLPDHLSDDPKALARFESEAKAVAALSHPHILAIHDFGRIDGVSYVVTELLEGDTLRVPLLRGPLPLRKALDVAAQLADALAAAHEKGIVHRDVKPENVFLSKDGRAKLLDFGLARHDAAFRSGEDSHAPTVTRNTDPGAVVGTISYMSPEQARGLPVGIGSDQFSLGVVLYEMLTGKRPFHGPSSAETLTAIIRAEPEPLGANVPAPVRWILDRLLAKDPADRYAATRDLARDLENCRSHLSEAAANVSSVSPARGSRRAPALIAGGLVALACLSAALLLPRRLSPTAPPPFHKLTFGKGAVGAARFTPDGFSVLYTAWWEGDTGPRMFSARLDAPAAARPLEYGGAQVVAAMGGEMALLLPRPEQAESPGVSRQVASLLATVPLGGGTPRPVLADVLAADLSPDGKTHAVVRRTDRRDRLEFPPGKVLFETAGWVRSLSVSPRGDLVAFTHWPLPTYPGGDLLVVGPEGKATALSVGWAQITGVRWSPDASEIWFTAGRPWGNQNLYAVRPDGRLRTLATTTSNYSLQDVRKDGRALLASGTSTVEVWGRGPGDVIERPYSWLDGSGATGISTDGRSLLFGEFSVGGGVECSAYLRRFDGTAPVRLGAGRPRGLSPDGSLALVVVRKPEAGLLLVSAGPGEPKALPKGPVAAFHWASFFPDGKRILLVGNEADRPIRLFVQDVAAGLPTPLSPEGVRVGEPSEAISPDGRLVAATSVADGTPVFVSVEDGTARTIEGLGPGDVPLSWTRDGKSLFVREPSSSRSARVVRFDLATRKKTLWKELRPADPTGASLVYQPVIARDGEIYFYTVTRALSNLFLVEGLR